MSEDSKPDDAAAAAMVPVPVSAPDGWRGDEHRLQVSAAQEAGLQAGEVELELYTEGFKSAMVLRDPADGDLVARGRTVLDDEQLKKSLRPVLMYLKIPSDASRVRVHDGEFELRVDSKAAQAGAPVLDASKSVLQIWLAAGVAILQLQLLGAFSTSAAAILWGSGLLYGSWQLRRGMVSGRAMLGARLSLGLAMLAREEQLILPPVATHPALPSSD